MTDIDPETVMAAHESHADWGCGWEPHPTGGRCLTFRLAEALAEAVASRNKYATAFAVEVLRKHEGAA